MQAFTYCSQKLELVLKEFNLQAWLCLALTVCVLISLDLEVWACQSQYAYRDAKHVQQTSLCWISGCLNRKVKTVLSWPLSSEGLMKVSCNRHETANNLKRRAWNCLTRKSSSDELLPKKLKNIAIIGPIAPAAGLAREPTVFIIIKLLTPPKWDKKVAV